jgi:tetratricopeptide (TPR) repeat protein
MVKGYANEIMQNYDEALKYYQKALEVSKDNPNVLTQIGHVYDLMGDNKNSKKYYEMAYKLDPESTNVRMQLARTYFDEGDYEKALNFFKYVYDNEANARRKAEAAMMLADIYSLDKTYSLKDLEYYAKKSVELDPSLPTA